MYNARRIALALSLATFIILCAADPDRCAAQTDAPATPGGTPTSPGGQKDTTAGQQGQQPSTQSASTIVASPGSTVVAPVPASGSNGLIVAAPGSTVVVQQQAQSASQSQKTSSAGKTNSFSSTKGDQATIDYLGAYAKDPSVSNLKRAGAIDALGILGAGADDATANAIAIHLGDVLKNEYISPPPTALKPSPKPLKYRDDNSEFLCFHVVQAAGNIGWGARSILPKMQLLRGENPILDTAIDRAVTAMQNSPAPQTNTSNPVQGSGTPNPAPSGK
jgi:hypothetical protein